MNRLAKEDLLRPLKKVNLPTCSNCLKGKMARKPFGKVIKTQIPLQLGSLKRLRSNECEGEAWCFIFDHIYRRFYKIRLCLFNISQM